MRPSRILAGIASVVAFLAVSFFASSPANAITSTCTIAAYGDSCIYWGQSYNGSHAGVAEAVSDFPVSGTTSYRYMSSGTGQKEFIGNNNGSNRNYDTVCTLTIWYNPGYSGYTLTLPTYPLSGYQRAGSGLGTLLNNIRAQSWYC